MLIKIFDIKFPYKCSHFKPFDKMNSLVSLTKMASETMIRPTNHNNKIQYKAKQSGQKQNFEH